LIDASKEKKDLQKFSSTISKIVQNIFIPICAGGGIRSIADAELLFNSGADKILLNSSLSENPNLVLELVKIYGSQSIVASIDFKINRGSPLVLINNGKTELDKDLITYIRYVQDLGIGEIYLNSIDKDGTGFGYDFSTINKVIEYINVPLIIAGGAGNEFHLAEGLKLDKVNAVATANLFNFLGDGLPIARKSLIQSGLNIAKWIF